MKEYDVTCAVTRMEVYRVSADNEEQAKQKAFGDGELVDTGETTNVEECDVVLFTKNPFDDEHYDGNDEQIEDLKTFGASCSGVLRSLYDHFGEAVEKDQPINGGDAVEVIGRAMPVIKALLQQTKEIE